MESEGIQPEVPHPHDEIALKPLLLLADPALIHTALQELAPANSRNFRSPKMRSPTTARTNVTYPNTARSTSNQACSGVAPGAEEEPASAWGKEPEKNCRAQESTTPRP